jgi:hypothetical protein
MKLRRSLLLTSVFCSLLLSNTALLSPRFQTVYITQMVNEMDQHLASRLTSSRTLWVVLDPASADAILTDSLDDSFWNWLAQTYPAPAAASSRAAAARSGAQATRHRGTIFLVDPRSRLVLWSAYDLPKNGTPAELDRAATRLTSQLRAAFVAIPEPAPCFQHSREPLPCRRKHRRCSGVRHSSDPNSSAQGTSTSKVRQPGRPGADRAADGSQNS